MTLRLYDTMAREKVDFVPRDPDRVSMYVCGPTVYDAPHVGHGRMATTFDVIRRYLDWRGLDVHFVSNVTESTTVSSNAMRNRARRFELAHSTRIVYFER